MVAFDIKPVPHRPTSGGYQPIAYDGRREMRALIAEMKSIERRDLRLTTRQWIRLAKRFVRAKWSLRGREMTLRPPRGGSGVIRPRPPASED